MSPLSVYGWLLPQWREIEGYVLCVVTSNCYYSTILNGNIQNTCFQGCRKRGGQGAMAPSLFRVRGPKYVLAPSLFERNSVKI